MENILMMPVNYKLYHPSWKFISYYIRYIKAFNRCEKCGVPNKSVGYWVGKQFITFEEYADTLVDTGEDLYRNIPIKKTLVTVVLTVAHLDQDINNNQLSNLKALCQRCHLNHDRPYNLQKIKERRHPGQLKLF